MKLTVFILILIVGVSIYFAWFYDAPLTSKEIEQINNAWNPPAVHITRGEHVSAVLALLQAPVLSINPEVPLWGVLLVIIAAVGAFAAVKMQMSNHETSDEQRFAAHDERFNRQDEMLAEIRADIKSLLGNGNNHHKL